MMVIIIRIVFFYLAAAAATTITIMPLKPVVQISVLFPQFTEYEGNNSLIITYSRSDGEENEAAG